jgi:acyl dehydratase
MNLEEVLRYEFPVIEHEYSFKDSILYALGLGYGTDPLDTSALRFVTEDDQRVVPTQCNVIGYPGFWLRDTPQLGFDWVRVLHGEQLIEVRRALPPSGKVRAHHRIVAIDDKGQDKGAATYFEKVIEDFTTGEVLATARWTIFARGDGGGGGFGEAPAGPAPITATEIESSCEIATSTRAALIYRLTADLNPIHSNPEIARSAGFDRPILHGMCTMGVACRAVLQNYCDNRPERLKSMFVRFSQPVFPGETIRVDFMREGGALRFRAFAVERGVMVLDRCSAEIDPSQSV